MTKQISIFGQETESWREHWEGMPEFNQEDMSSFDHIKVHFKSIEDRDNFLDLLGYDHGRKKSIWFPRVEYLQQSSKMVDAVLVEKNRYPIFVISKGRHQKRLTASALDKLGIPYHIIVEPQEFNLYADHIEKEKILVLPFSNLGQGSIPARNWVLEYSISQGDIAHWILDDNIDGFYELNNNLKKKVVDFNPFIKIENFMDKYKNLFIAGMNYEFFMNRRSKQKPYYLNTRVYSCILIKNEIPHRWRGRYNEDTDLCIRVLKDGGCTVLFNNVLAKKMPTMKMPGGNTDELYADDGRIKMAESLKEQHPDIVSITKKWGRSQHVVNYKVFKYNKLEKI
jgi:hypothetical protein